MKRLGPSAFADWLSAKQATIHSWLAVLSILALALVISTETVSQDFVVPVIKLSWSSLQISLRSLIWLAYISVFITYMLLGWNRLSYFRTHLTAFIICWTWVPHYTAGFLHRLDLTHLVPIDVLQLVGTLAHAWIVVRWTASNFRGHPFFVVGSTALVLIASGAGVLHLVEPQTFPSFWDGAWFALVTATTIGYGDLVPHTALGRLVTSVLALSGISLLGILLSITTVIMKKKILAEDPEEDLKKNNVLLERLIVEVQTNNRLLQELRDNGCPPFQKDGGASAAEELKRQSKTEDKP